MRNESALLSRSLPERDGNTLIWTERWYLVGIALASFVAAIADALFGWKLDNSVFKHFPLILTIPAFFLHFIGGPIFGRAQGYWKAVFSVVWPLILLGVYVVVGSLYARYGRDILETFLTLGVYVWLTFFSAVFVLQSSRPRKLVKAYVGILLVIAFSLAGAVLIDYKGIVGSIHEKEFLVIPAAILFFTAFNNPTIRWAGALFFLAIAALGHKNTSYLVGLFVMIYVILIWYRNSPTRNILKRFMKAYLLVIIGIAILAATIFLILNKEQYLQSGNSTYRLFQYSIAWDAFEKSPIWGNGFTSNSGQEFTLWFDPNIGKTSLPTHNDVLDLAKNGGVIAVMLWAFGLAKIGKVVYAKVFSMHTEGDWRRPYVHLLLAMSMAAIIVYMFNPLLVKPGLAYLIWTNLGFLVGIALLPNNKGREAAMS